MATRQEYLRMKCERPWLLVLYGVRSRCKLGGYKNRNYSGKGIKSYLTPKDIKTLWIRDKANIMSKPSIDRINSKGNYTFSNCRFIELRDNVLNGNCLAAKNARKTHCKRGHSLSGDNLKIATDGSRKCIKCTKLLQIKWDKHRRNYGRNPMVNG